MDLGLSPLILRKWRRPILQSVAECPSADVMCDVHSRARRSGSCRGRVFHCPLAAQRAIALINPESRGITYRSVSDVVGAQKVSICGSDAPSIPLLRHARQLHVLRAELAAGGRHQGSFGSRQIDWRRGVKWPPSAACQAARGSEEVRTSTRAEAPRHDRRGR